MRPELPLTTSASAVVALTVVVALAGYAAVVLPMRREVARLDAQAKTVLARSAPVAVPIAPISDEERDLWRELESRLRTRFVATEDQLRAVAEVVELASAAGLSVRGLELQVRPASAAPQAASPVFEMPGGFSVNPGTIRLTAYHGYGHLLDFLDRMHRATRYVTVESLDLRRTGDRLESDTRFVTVRWQR